MAMSSNNSKNNPPPRPITKSGLGRSAPIRTVPSGLAPPPPLVVPHHGLAPSSSRPSKKISSTVIAAKQSAIPPSSASDGNEPHVVPLPPPRQTQIHPLVGSSRQQQPSNKQPSSSERVSSPSDPRISSPQQQQQPALSSLPKSSPSRKSSPSTPDEETDAFLRHNNNNNNNASAQLRPPPLPRTSDPLSKSKLLAARRAWGDVIRVSDDAFLIEGGGYRRVYTELLRAASDENAFAENRTTTANTANDNDDDDESTTLRREVCELIALRCIARLKLRRYVDLGKEIASLGLIPHLPPHPSSNCGVTMDGSPSQPSPGGTEVIPLSSVATNSINTTNNKNNSNNSNNNTAAENHSMSWKEGSLHSAHQRDRLPPWVPYGLRILAAQHLQYVDGSSRAVDVLYDMRDRSDRTDYWNAAADDTHVDTNANAVWRGVIDNALVNAFVRKKEWRMALRTLDIMLSDLEDGVEREADRWIATSGQFVDAGTTGFIKDLIASAAAVELMSRQIRILLRCGALDVAASVQRDVAARITRMEAVSGSDDKTPLMVRLHRESTLVRQAPFRRRVNEGLLLFANGSYVDASVQFHDALQSQKEFDKVYDSALSGSTAAAAAHNLPGIPSWNELSDPTLGFDTDPSLTVECLNNLSLCLLYSGNMRRAVHELEGLVRENPTAYLTEGMAFNLCTLYELGSDGEECIKRKKVLQRVAKRFYLHDVGVESFRLN